MHFQPTPCTFKAMARVATTSPRGAPRGESPQQAQGSGPDPARQVLHSKSPFLTLMHYNQK